LLRDFWALIFDSFCDVSGTLRRSLPIAATCR
jgi:hypothetical protein